MIARRTLALFILAIGVALACSYLPGAAYGLGILAASLLIAYLLYDWWIAAIPVALIAGDLYPWTGSLLISEFDLFLSATLAVTVWRLPKGAAHLCGRRGVYLLWIPLVLSIALGVYRGWQLGIPGLVDDNLGLYTARWNALRVSKGAFWGLLLALVILSEASRKPQQSCRFFAGVRVSVMLVAVAVIWERALAFGVFNFQQLYRATGPFFSMHTGGQHIDAFCALALPFVLAPITSRPTWYSLFWRSILLPASYYTMVGTMSRAIIVWALMATLLMSMLWSWLLLPRRWWLPVSGIAAVAVAFIYGVLVVKSDVMQQRFSESRQDLALRWEQWGQLCRASARDVTTRVIGNGIGSAPTLVSRAQSQPLRPAELIAIQNGETALRLRAGKAVYVEQLVNRRAPGPWQLRGKLRSSASVDVGVYICQKMLFDSLRCAEKQFTQSDENRWMPFVWNVDVSWLSQGRRQCPVTLAFAPVGDGGFVDLAGLQLTDADGLPLLSNADFSSGSAYWFFTSDDHSAWRAENMWVHLFLEQGYFGVASVAWLVIGTLIILIFKSDPQRRVTCYVFAVSIVGFLIVGLFGALLDTPWIITFLFVTMALAQCEGASPSE